MPDTSLFPRSRSDPDTERDPGWRVVLFNDDITPIELVVLAVQKAAGLSLEVAEMIVEEAHRSGSAVVKRGLDRQQAEEICAILQRETRLDGQLPGVHCEAQRE